MQDALFSAGLPKLVIDQNDIAGSWEQFKLEFFMTLQLKVYCTGNSGIFVRDNEVELWFLLKPWVACTNARFERFIPNVNFRPANCF